MPILFNTQFRYLKGNVKQWSDKFQLDPMNNGTNSLFHVRGFNDKGKVIPNIVRKINLDTDNSAVYKINLVDGTGFYLSENTQIAVNKQGNNFIYASIAIGNLYPSARVVLEKDGNLCESSVKAIQLISISENCYIVRTLRDNYIVEPGIIVKAD